MQTVFESLVWSRRLLSSGQATRANHFIDFSFSYGMSPTLYCLIGKRFPQTINIDGPNLQIE
jgi:hypothetical protein